MKHLRIIPILSVVFVICACTSPVEKFRQEQMQKFKILKSPVIFYDRQHDWYYAGSSFTRGEEIIKFFLPEENQDHWKERITIKYLPIKSDVAVSDYFANEIKEKYKDICYYHPPFFHIIQKDNSNLIYQFNLRYCGKLADQAGIGKVMNDASGHIAVITYAAKGVKLNKQQWELAAKLIQSAQIIQPT